MKAREAFSSIQINFNLLIVKVKIDHVKYIQSTVFT